MLVGYLYPFDNNENIYNFIKDVKTKFTILYIIDPNATEVDSLEDLYIHCGKIKKIKEKTINHKVCNIGIIVNNPNFKFTNANSDFTININVTIINNIDVAVEILNVHIDEFFNNKDKVASVAVVDLDDTIINKDYKVIIDLKYFTNLKKYFDYVILWSYGDDNHVQYAIHHCNLNFFNYVLSKRKHETTYNKSLNQILLFLNKMKGVVKFSKTLLIDDQETNYNNDYDIFFNVPTDITQYQTEFDNLYKMLPNYINANPN